MYKRNIQRLTQTYLTLSLQDIAKIVQLSSPKEAEMHVLQMVVSYAIILDAKLTAVSYITFLLFFCMINLLQNTESRKTTNSALLYLIP
jgi:hypothetical protein